MGKKIRYLIDNEKCVYLPLWSFTRYRNKSLRPPLFSDVLPCFRKWNSEPLFIKLFTFASGPSEIQKLFLQYVMYRFTRLGEARRERAPQTVVLIVFNYLLVFFRASASADGDISNYVTYSFDTRHSFKYDSVKYQQVVNSLGEREPKNLFYLVRLFEGHV